MPHTIQFDNFSITLTDFNHLDLDDPDVMSFFKKNLDWRLKKAINTAIRVTNTEIKAFRDSEAIKALNDEKARLEAEHAKFEEEYKRRQKEGEEFLNRLRAEMAEMVASYKPKEPPRPEKTPPIKMDNESEGQFLERMANNANARRDWDKKYKR